MSRPFAERSIVMEFETGRPEEYLQFEPSRLPHDVWLHRRSEFDPTLSREELVEQYVLPASDSYQVRIVEVPEGETMQLGTLAGTDDREGGADLVHLSSREEVPAEWVREERPLTELLE